MGTLAPLSEVSECFSLPVTDKVLKDIYEASIDHAKYEMVMGSSKFHR
jgi:hypothetical protein